MDKSKNSDKQLDDKKQEAAIEMDSIKLDLAKEDTTKNYISNLPSGDYSPEKIKLDISQGFQVPESEFIGISNDKLTEESLPFLKSKIQESRPQKIDENGDAKPFPIGATHSGNICCCCNKSKRIGELTDFGIGIVTYFQVLKALAIGFLVITIINIPILVFYYMNYPEKPIISYEDALYKTSIGNLDGYWFNCKKINISEIDNGVTNNDFCIGGDSEHCTFQFDCKNYYISKLTASGLSKGKEKEAKNLENCAMFSRNLELSVTENKEIREELSNSFGERNKSLNVTFSLSDYKTKLNSESSEEVGDYFFIAYSCYNDEVNLTQNKTIKRKYFPYILVIVDVVGGLILLIILFTISVSHKSVKKYFRENLIQISDYTLRIKNLNFEYNRIGDDIMELIEHIEKILKEQNKNMPNTNNNSMNEYIYDFKYPNVTTYKLDLVAKSNSIHAKTSSKKEKEVAELSNKIQQSKEHPRIIKEIYITFTNQKYRNQIYNVYRNLLCRCKCLHKNILFRGEFLDISRITEQPSNIVWENVTRSSCKRKCKKALLIILSIVILLLPFGVAVGTTYAQKELYKKFNTYLDCTAFDRPNATNVIDEIKSHFTEEEYKDGTAKRKIESGEANLRDYDNTYCFCFYESIDSLLKGTKNKEVDGIKVCKNWVKLYTLSLGLKILFIIIVPVFNVIFSMLLQVITRGQNEKTLSNYYTSYMVKSFILQLINTGLLIVLTNMLIKEVKDWVSDFPLFTGSSEDMDPQWFSTVGVSLIFSMILNIVTPHASPFIFFILNKIKLCIDKCTSSPLKTKCKTRKEYLDLYMGPDFDVSLRYASILTTVFITLLYCSGMPLLYLCCAFFLIITYWVDKILLLRYYKYPPNIDLFLDTYTNVIIFFGLILHFAFGIWIYGNDRYLAADQDVMNSIKDIIEEYINSYTEITGFSVNFVRVFYTHNVIMLVFLILLILIFIYRLFFHNFVLKNCCSFVVDQKNIKTVNIYDAITIEKLYEVFNVRKARIKNGEMAKYNNLIKFYVKMCELDKIKIINRLTHPDELDNNNAVINTEEIKDDVEEALPKFINERIFNKTMKKGKIIKKRKIVDDANQEREIIMIDRNYTYQHIEEETYQDFNYYYLYLSEDKRFHLKGEEGANDKNDAIVEDGDKNKKEGEQEEKK